MSIIIFLMKILNPNMIGKSERRDYYKEKLIARGPPNAAELTTLELFFARINWDRASTFWFAELGQGLLS